MSLATVTTNTTLLRTDTHALRDFWAEKGVKIFIGFWNFAYKFLGVGEMFVGDLADTFTEKIQLVLMGGDTLFLFVLL